MRRGYRSRRKSNVGWLMLLLVIIFTIISGGGYIYFSEEFERVAPKIDMPKFIFWNTKKPLTVKISDNYGLKSYRILLSDGVNSVLIASKNNMNLIKNKEIKISYPENSKLDKNAKVLEVIVNVQDASRWNYFLGNTSQEIITLRIDNKRPTINILSNSYSIRKGGSALVIFQALDDDKLSNVYIEVGHHKFKAQPYKKEGYFVSLIAWSFREDNFKAHIVVKDRAGNSRSAEIPLYIRNQNKRVNYRTSWIRATDKFINGKITDLAEQDDKYMKEDKLERLKAINENMRIENEILIKKYTSKISNDILYDWKIKRFYPLKHGKKVANFGDDRHYYYTDKEKEISQSYHLGYDMASTQMATITTSNDGKVVFAEYNGIYGNMPIIDHGLGLYTLYGHCATLEVKEGDIVKVGQKIAQTGKTGLALGDHLHFGILVQGVEVRPIEWLDKKWIRDNIEKIFADANKIINPKDSEKD